MNIKEKYKKYKCKYMTLKVINKVQNLIKIHIKESRLKKFTIKNNSDTLCKIEDFDKMFSGKGSDVLINFFPKLDSNLYNNIKNNIQNYEYLIYVFKINKISDIDFNKILKLDAFKQFYYLYYSNVYLILSEKSNIKLPVFELIDIKGQKILNTNYEKKEQQYLLSYIKSDDVILSLGGNIGTSCILVDKLTDGINVCVEPNKKVISTLEENKKLNSSRFKIINGVISKKKRKLVLIDSDDLGLASYTVKEKNSKGQIIDNYDFNKLNKDYKFNTLFADCEACLPLFFTEYPESLNSFKKVIFEMDYYNYVDYEIVFDILAKYGFIQMHSIDIQVFIHHSLLKYDTNSKLEIED